MPDENDEIVGSLGREVVLHLVPEELPLYSSLVNQFQSAKRGRKGSSDDQVLGFGAAEAVTMLTPVILSFSREFWQALLAQAAQDAVHGVVEYVKARLGRGGESGPGQPPPLTLSQLQVVRVVAEREARRLDISEEQAGLLADVMVGVLSASEPS
jgi:hypothetical protein